MSVSVEDMWQKACFMTRVVASSVRVAEQAGAVIKGIMSDGDLKIVDKGIDGAVDLQTEADRSAQYCIVHSLQKKFNESLTIIGEEENPSKVHYLEEKVSNAVLSIDSKCPEYIRSIKESDVVIWVDPLDGTSEFAQAAKDKSPLLHQVTVLIGITYKGKPVGGVIHQPYFGDDHAGRTVWAIQGCGAHGIDIAKEQSRKVVVTTRSHSTQLVNDALESLKTRGLADDVERVGGAGFKVLKILEGAAAYVFASNGCKKWDTAAPEAVLSAAGGQLTDISGRSLYYGVDAQVPNTGGVLATAPWTDHSEYVNAIPQPVKDILPEVSGS